MSDNTGSLALPTGGLPTPTPFLFGDRTVRALAIDGDPWFVVADICAALGIANVGNALARLDDDEKSSVRLADGTPGTPNRAIVSEPGMYRLVFRSDKPDAERFTKWVARDVLPQIRRAGQYVPKQRQPAIPQTMSEALRLAADEHDRANAAETRVAELEPAAESWNTLATANGDYLVADAAKILSSDPDIKLGQNRLYRVLSDLGWLFKPADRRWRAYQQHVDNGRLSLIAMSHYHPRTGELVVDPPQIRITVKGLGWLHQHLGGTRALALPSEQLQIGGAR